VKRIGACFALVAWLLASGRAGAHPTPSSVALIDFTVDGARIEQDVPVEELERALKRRLAQPGEAAARLALRHEAALRAYAAAHMQARSQAPWSVEVVDVAGHDAADGPRVRFRFVLRAPAGEAGRSLELRDDIVAHEVVSHYIVMYLRSDWSAGVLGAQAPQLVGTVHAGRNVVTVKRAGSFARGLRSMVGLGVEHISTGTDHLLFLFALVLVAPAAVSGRRWQRRRSLRDTLVTLGYVVSAFTVGHSLTLALGVLAGVSLPSAFVEAAIAASILLTALHALRPLFARREAAIAGVFGLIHGLAFASSLAQRDLGPAQAAWTLFGFNLGIELAQLGLLFLVMPWILMLARTRWYDAFRVACAWFTALLACAWLVERTAGVENPTAPVVSWIEVHAFVLLVVLAWLAFAARLADQVVISRSPAAVDGGEQGLAGMKQPGAVHPRG
jgi:hypothetical protein